MTSFGELLRECRLRGKLSQERLGGLLGQELNLQKGYSAAAVSDWERGVSTIHANDRLLLVSLLKALHEKGGITEIEKANDLLLAGNFRPLDEDETQKIFPRVQAEAPKSPQGQTPVNPENNHSIENWPPYIPVEPYYPLPDREGILKSLLGLVRKKGTPRIISIEGLGGHGKTALAAELARRALQNNLVDMVIGETAKQELFAEGEIIQLQSSTLDYEGLLDGLGRQLQKWELLAMSAKEKEVFLSQMFLKSHYLVIVDNLETASNAQAIAARLSSILGSSQAIMTSREKLRNNSSYSMVLQGLSLKDSNYFLRSESQRVGTNALMRASQTLLSEVHDLSGGSPMAMKLLVAQAKYLDLDVVLEQLRNAKGNLFPFIFRQSWEQLIPEAQNLLIYIGKTVVESVSLKELVQAQIADSHGKLIAAIDQLVGYSLLNYSHSQAEIRYHIHPLTRQFVMSDLPRMWREQGLM